MTCVASTHPARNYIWRLSIGLQYACFPSRAMPVHPSCGVHADVGIVDSPAQRFAVAQFMRFARANVHRWCYWILAVKRFPIGIVQCVNILPQARGLQH